MIKLIIPVVVGVFGFCAAAFAQQPASLPASFEDPITLWQLRSTGVESTVSALTLLRADLSTASNGSVLIHGLPTLTLLDGRRLADSSAAEMGLSISGVMPLNFLQGITIEKASATQFGTDAPGGVANLLLNRDRSGVEAGFYFGHSAGGLGRQEMQSYIVGGVGNERTQISAGASYQQFNGRVSR